MSTSTADPVLQPLSRSRFDAVDYLNDVLPTVTLSSQAQSGKIARTGQLQTASTDLQASLSKINAHNIRTSSDLTVLTDEILRSGNRLAYEVEILRGDVNSFYDLLTDTLKDDIRLFVREEVLSSSAEKDGADAESLPGTQPQQEPAFITQLRRLTQVKERLEAVVNLFGEAMKWPVPPSELGSSLITVSAPELGGIQTTDGDDKARDATKKIRVEIQDLLDSDGGGTAGLEAASRRVEEYRQLAGLWKGTSEEKVRIRFVEGLQRLVDDRKRNLEARGISERSRTGSPHRTASAQGRPARHDGGGLFRNLARLKDDLYLD
ncbi:uncharacterized protein AB675_11112 [Cyphellophora attinorum]|uniref:Uncharacterized protein n=1 Tax=Cyphellophora attinorum TaxID=1664694 RepID=A0A0N0NII9_9EURO|nr:uncharacterized protein AB675_11112 [Phialophora attinorum]KPI35798.1 hypothetical protein AB675_11112 [Phialophora attinorum]